MWARNNKFWHLPAIFLMYFNLPADFFQRVAGQMPDRLLPASQSMFFSEHFHNNQFNKNNNSHSAVHLI